MPNVVVVEVIISLCDGILEANSNSYPSHKFNYLNPPSHLGGAS